MNKFNNYCQQFEYSNLLSQLLEKNENTQLELLLQQQNEFQKLLNNHQQTQEQQYQQRQQQYQLQYNQPYIIPTQLQKPTTTTINTPTKKTKGRPPKLEINEKVINRRINQNISSKKSREKKLDQLKEMEDKVTELTKENDQLSKENQLYINIIKRNGGGEEQGRIFRPNPEFLNWVTQSNDILLQLGKSLETNDERSLIYLLHLYHGIISKCYPIIEKEVNKFIHPFSQLQLAELIYIPSPDIDDDNISRNIFSSKGSDQWINQFKKESNLSLEQSTKFENIRTQYRIDDDKLTNEKRVLDQDIKSFYFKYIIPPQSPFNMDYYSGSINEEGPLKFSETLEMVIKLITLKNKTIASRLILFETLTSICSILTPVQEALLLFKVNPFQTVNFSLVETLIGLRSNINSSTTLKDIIVDTNKQF